MSSIKIKQNKKERLYISEIVSVCVLKCGGNILSGSSGRQELFPVFVPYIANDSYALLQSLSCSVCRERSFYPLYF